MLKSDIIKIILYGISILILGLAYTQTIETKLTETIVKSVHFEKGINRNELKIDRHIDKSDITFNKLMDQMRENHKEILDILRNTEKNRK